MIDSSIIFRFVNFLQEFTLKGELYYVNKVDEMIATGQRSLNVDVMHLVDFDQAFIDFILKTPEIAFDACKDALKQIILVRDDLDFLHQMQNRVHIRFYNLPTYAALPLRKINAGYHQKLIQTEALVTSATTIKPKIELGVFRCNRCKSRQPSIPYNDSFSKPTSCIGAASSGDSCPSKSFSSIKEDFSLVNFQEILIQEKQEELEAGQIPRIFNVYLYDDLVDSVSPGDRVTLVAIYKTNSPEQLKIGSFPVLNKYLEAIHFTKEADEFSSINFTTKDIKDFYKLAKRPDAHSFIINSIAPRLKGCLEAKEGGCYATFGGVEKNHGDQRIRGEINFLVTGDPSLGKTVLIKSLARLVPRSIITHATRSSAAGLTCAVVQDKNGRWMLEAGAVVLGDKGMTVIDELDKMTKVIRNALLEAMEAQKVTISKAGIHASLNARTSIVASSNPKDGKWNPNHTFLKNVGLEPPLLSRFDLTFLIENNLTDEDEEDIANHIGDIYQEKLQSGSDSLLSQEFLKKYVAYARANIKPKITDEARQLILQFYLDLRKQSKNEESDGSILIERRQLESLFRLSEARAKMVLRSEVTEEDAENVIKLYKTYLNKVLQGDIGSIYGLPAQKRNQREIILNAIRTLNTNGKGVLKHNIIANCKAQGLNKDSVKELFDLLLKGGEIFLSKQSNGEDLYKIHVNSGENIPEYTEHIMRYEDFFIDLIRKLDNLGEGVPIKDLLEPAKLQGITEKRLRQLLDNMIHRGKIYPPKHEVYRVFT